ncbi:MAG: dienelactone hydrolase family protein [Thermoanaerobaculia bacterium]
MKQKATRTAALLITTALLLGAGVAGAQEAPQAPAAGEPAVPADADGAEAALADSPRHGEWVDVELADGSELTTWVVYPERPDKAGAVIVIHEVFGLTDWARAVADRLAADGFIALAPDLLSGKGPDGGGTESLGERVREVIRELEPAEVHARLDAVRGYAMGLPAANGRVGAVGFCWGGSTSFAYAGAQPELDAAVVYYGGSPEEPGDYETVEAPVLGLYGADDARVNATIPAAEEQMERLGKSYTTHVYEGAGHGFLREQDERDGANRRAADQAWPATLAFFREHLEGTP